MGVSSARVILGPVFLAVMLLSVVPSVSAARAPVTTWMHTYIPEAVNSIQETSDGGFVAAGRGFGLWVMKANSTGGSEWSRYYSPAGYGSDAEALSVQQTRDGGFIVAGDAISDLYVTGIDALLLKLDPNGNVQWSKTYGGRNYDSFYVVEQTKDGGYVVAGNTASVSSHFSNGWVLRLDLSGNIVWQEAFVGEDIHSVDQTEDGGFVVAGTVGVDNKAEGWVFKLDRDGRMVWQKAYEFAITNRIKQTRDGGYVVAGGPLILRLDRIGNVVWERSFNGGGYTQLFSISETKDKGFVLAGEFSPNELGHGISGPFLLKLDSEGVLLWQKVYRVDMLSDAQGTRDGGIIAAGGTQKALVLKLDGQGRVGDCLIGVTSNATLTDASAIVTKTRVAGIDSHTAVSQTSAMVTSAMTYLQTLCIPSRNEGRVAREIGRRYLSSQ
jgi:hypothetical protein